MAVIRCLWMPGLVGLNRGDDPVRRCMGDRKLINHRDRRLLAAPDAGRCNDPEIGSAQQGGKALEQLFAPREYATQATAYPNGQCGGLAIAADDVEVMIKCSNFIDLGHREIHQLGQGHQMAFAKTTVRVVDAVQVLDEQVATVAVCWAGSDQGFHLGQRCGVGLASFEFAAAPNLLAHAVGSCEDRRHVIAQQD